MGYLSSFQCVVLRQMLAKVEKKSTLDDSQPDKLGHITLTRRVKSVEP